MDSYYDYLEKQIKLREEEIKIYKDFIERELGCRIKVTLESRDRCGDFGEKMVQFKVITIPQSKYYIKFSD